MSHRRAGSADFDEPGKESGDDAKTKCYGKAEAKESKSDGKA